MRSFCRKTRVRKIPRFGGGGGILGFLGGGGSADFIFMGARIFLIEGKELGPWRFRPFYANQSSELNFLIFLGKSGPNSEERGIHTNPS